MAVTAQFEYHPGTLLDDAKKIKRKRNEQLWSWKNIFTDFLYKH